MVLPHQCYSLSSDVLELGAVVGGWLAAFLNDRSGYLIWYLVRKVSIFKQKGRNRCTDCQFTQMLTPAAAPDYGGEPVNMGAATPCDPRLGAAGRWVGKQY